MKLLIAGVTSGTATLAMVLALALPSTAEGTNIEGCEDGPMMQGDLVRGPLDFDKSLATMAFMAANDRMRKCMAIIYSNHVDYDFIQNMIPHHEGAVEMARIVLKYGSDPKVLKLAQDIISAEEARITWMQDWLIENGG